MFTLTSSWTSGVTGFRTYRDRNNINSHVSIVSWRRNTAVEEVVRVRLGFVACTL